MEKAENKAHELSSTELWANASHAEIFKTFGFSEIEVDRTCAFDPLPESIYNVKKRSASLETLTNIMGRQTWPSLTYQHAAVLPAEIQMMVQAHVQQDAFEQLSQTWRNSFLVSGLLVRERSAGTGQKPTWLSLGPWPNNAGVLLLKVEKHETSKNMFSWHPGPVYLPDALTAPFAKDAKMKWVHVSDLDAWVVLPTILLSPLHRAVRERKAGQCLQIRGLHGAWVETDKPVALVKHVAMHGFFDMGSAAIKRFLEDRCSRTC